MSAIKHYADLLRQDLEDDDVFEMLATQQEYDLLAAQDTEPSQWLMTYTPNQETTK